MGKLVLLAEKCLGEEEFHGEDGSFSHEKRGKEKCQVDVSPVADMWVRLEAKGNQ